MPNEPPPPRITYVFIFVSVNDSPAIVAGVPGVAEQREPAIGVVVELGRQDPALEDRLLLRGVVAVHLHERAAGAQALDLPQGQNRARPWKIVNGVDREHAVE